MAAPPVKLDVDDYGYLAFEFEGSQAPPPVRLDLYEANAAYLRAHQDGAGEPWPQFGAWLQALGFPALSHMNLARVIAAVQAEIERLGKAAAGSPTPG